MKLYVFNKELHNNNQINLKRSQSIICEFLNEPCNFYLEEYIFLLIFLLLIVAKIKRDFFQEFANKFKGQSLFNILHVLSDSIQEIQVIYFL